MTFIIMSSNAFNGKLTKNLKERFFLTRQLCHGEDLLRPLKWCHACTFKMKNVTGPKTVKIFKTR